MAYNALHLPEVAVYLTQTQPGFAALGRADRWRQIIARARVEWQNAQAAAAAASQDNG